MKRMIGLLAAALLVTGASGEDPKKEAKMVVRLLDVKISGAPKGKPTEPSVYATADELEKAIADKDAVAAIKKAVHFDKEQVVHFAWSGSGQDKLTLSTEEGKKGPEVTFAYSPGRTRDLRPHVKVFALAKGATFKVSTQR
jgi:hypothetical protein